MGVPAIASKFTGRMSRVKGDSQLCVPSIARNGKSDTCLCDRCHNGCRRRTWAAKSHGAAGNRRGGLRGPSREGNAQQVAYLRTGSAVCLRRRGSPEIADVLPMSDRVLYVQGKKVGTTNVSVFGKDKRLIAILDVEVAIDARAIAEKIVRIWKARALPFQAAKIS